MKTNLKLMTFATLLIIVLSSFLQIKKSDNEINAVNKEKIKTVANQNEEPNRLLPEKLRGLDYGIQGSHFPNPTYATFEDGMYVWKHDTSVLSANEDLQIVEYGSYVYTDKGWYLRVTYDTKMFAETYNCKDGLLKKGVTYTDPTSWRKSEILVSGDAMWFYIAKNKEGKLVKGTAVVETEAKLVDKTNTIEKQISQEELINSENKTLVFDTKKSVINWTGYGEVGGYSLTGTINLKDAKFEILKNKIVSGTIIIDATSINHNDSNLKAHLKNEDFFNVEKYPTAILKITKSNILKNNEIEVFGNLTIKEVTKAISFKMKEVNQNYSGKITIDRTAFGVQYGSKSFFDNLGDQAIKNEFDLEFKLVSTKKPSN
jgi:polyisoprenoid-binding protein YceI